MSTLSVEYLQKNTSAEKLRGGKDVKNLEIF